MNIGDIFLRVLANLEGFEADIVTKAGVAGDKAGATLGQRLGAAVKQNGAKIIGAALAAGAAIAARGLLELQNIEADFRAETGATEEQAKRAGKAINDMSSRNIQPMREIGDALTKVHTDMGLTGVAAEKLTERFLRFGRVTKVNAATEVTNFDDILDAWNLTADHSGEIMDALVVSHQRYGGVIADDELALRDLAPVLLATNQTWEDGLALINLFKASGVDVAVAVTGITKALTKVKSPEELKQLIADIIATEDPLARAAKASDLFGAKAGPKLANVLKPGIGGLEDYAISADEAAGATEKAAQVLDDTWGARFQLLIKKAGSAIIGFGNDWGGLATVIATTLTIAGGLGGGKLATALGKGLGLAWTKVAGSAVVTRAVAFAAGKAATVYLTALIVGDKLGAALSKAWLATGGRLIAAAGISGAAAGRAFAIGAAAAIVAAPLIVLKVALDIQEGINRYGDALRQQATDFAKNATDVELQKAIAGVQGRLDGMVFNTFESKNKVIDVLNELIAESNRRAGLGAQAIDTVTVATDNLAMEGGRNFGAVGTAARRMADTIKTNAQQIADAVTTLTGRLVTEAKAMIDGYYDPIIAQDELRVAQDAVMAAEVERNAIKAGDAARHQADLTLANAKKNLDETRLNLLASGTLTAKDQAKWLADLEADYKHSTGEARTRIAELIKKIHELQKIPTTVIDIVARIRESMVQKPGQKPIPRAGGGEVVKGRPYLVNESTPDSEIWVPELSGRVLGPSATPAAATAQTPSWPPITINNPVPHAADEDIGRMMRRLSALGLGG